MAQSTFREIGQFELEMEAEIQLAMRAVYGTN